MTAAITAHHYGYRHASRKAYAFRDLNFSIEEGATVLLLGASGVGKSTLLHAIAGLLGHDDGEHEGRLDVRGRVGMVLQDPDSQVIASRVGDDVAFGCENARVPREEIWRRVPAALRQVGLDLPLDHPTSELSGGQKQRLALAGVLAMETDVVLLDEPTANIDPRGVEEVVQAVRNIDRTTIIVEHRVDTWVSHVDAVLVLGQDGVLAYGDPRRVLQDQERQLIEAGVWVPGLTPTLPPTEPVADGVQAALQCENLQVGWDQAVGPVHEFGVPLGHSTVVTGANGAGKSTLLLTLGGLLPPVEGRVVAAEKVRGNLGDDPLRWRSVDLAQRIGFVFQDPEHQFVAKTVREELLVGTQRLGPADRDRCAQLAEHLLEELGLRHLAQANPFTLSGGQKRRLSVATVLVHSPAVVLLDEPTFGQDRTTFVALVRLLRDLTKQGTTVCSITHDPLYRRCLGDGEIEL